jgi:hypothetical protein
MHTYRRKNRTSYAFGGFVNDSKTWFLFHISVGQCSSRKTAVKTDSHTIPINTLLGKREFAEHENTWYM